MNDKDLATGWYEFSHQSKATTHIASVGECGRVYIPEQDISVDDFFEALLAGKAFKLVREYEHPCCDIPHTPYRQGENK